MDGQFIAITVSPPGNMRAACRRIVDIGHDPVEIARIDQTRQSVALERSIDVQISRLRRMLEPDPSKPRYIQTVWGVGYVFVPDGNAGK